MMRATLELFRPDDDRTGAPDSTYLYRVIVEQPPQTDTVTWYTSLADAATAIGNITVLGTDV